MWIRWRFSTVIIIPEEWERIVIDNIIIRS
jgi:hypothetical protein